MDISELADAETEKRIIETWQGMDEDDKGHFINQVALAMSIWGSDQDGRLLVVQVLKHMADNDTKTLADFGLYIESALVTSEPGGMPLNKIRRASLIIEGYRIKNALSSVPHKEIGL
ncbi:MAG: hypothetical protein ABII71_01155 [Candidatus Micrarchaeota archaeon]